MLQLKRAHAAASDVVTIARPGFREHHVTARRAGDDDLSVFHHPVLTESTTLFQFVFGGCRFHEASLASTPEAERPVTWVHGDGCSGERLSSAQTLAVAGVSVERIKLDGRVVGCSYEDADAQYCYLGGIVPKDRRSPRTDQARNVFEILEEALARVGMGFSHVVRTWLYLEDILSWYGQFNIVRTAFFHERGVFDGLIPASTGIGGANPARSALSASLVAIKPKTTAVNVFSVPSPLQCQATEYKSSFSRAVEIHLTGRRQLYVSGTASIEPGGETAHRGDVDKQIELTMEVVEAILRSREMGWGDTTRCTAYFKDMRDVPRFEAFLRNRDLPRLPLAYSHAAVCRDDLLFEIEADAIRLTG